MSSQQQGLRCKHSGFAAISSWTVHILSGSTAIAKQTMQSLPCLLQSNKKSQCRSPKTPLFSVFCFPQTVGPSASTSFVCHLCSVLQPRLRVQCWWECIVPCCSAGREDKVPSPTAISWCHQGSALSHVGSSPLHAHMACWKLGSAALRLARLMLFDRLRGRVEVHKCPLLYGRVIAVAYFQP